MKILLTGATGYIGQRLLPVLIQKGHEVVCCVRDKTRFDASKYDSNRIAVVQVDFLQADTLTAIPKDIDAVYYLLHSMSTNDSDFEDLERKTARNFKNCIQQTTVKHVIYLGGIVNEAHLSKHLRSRQQVETILASETYHLTTLRAGIIVGSGSASFEIIRDLVEKLPLMIAPRWLYTKCQPIAIGNVIEFLERVLLNEAVFDHSFDIGGLEILTYKEMLLKFAAIRKLRRIIITVPVMTPRLSSYWLYFVTSTTFSLARNLVDSMKVNVICRPNELHKSLGIHLIGYEAAIRDAFGKFEQNPIVTSWDAAHDKTSRDRQMNHYLEAPVYGCYRDEHQISIDDPESVLNRIWSIGGSNGWYYADWLWRLRGFLDQLVGGVGLRRGKTNQSQISSGESVDFWHVLLADRAERRLLLFAEMQLPGEAWLEFKIDAANVLHQTVTFRPFGLPGRLYWYSVLPFHRFIFSGMIRRIAKSSTYLRTEPT